MRLIFKLLKNDIDINLKDRKKNYYYEIYN